MSGIGSSSCPRHAWHGGLRRERSAASHRWPSITFRHVLGTDPNVSEFQVRQTAAGADILTVGRPDVIAL
jgi:hypothetical protein